MKKIYKTYLRKYYACEEQVKLFEKLYPKGIHVCKDCLRDAQNQGLDVWWLPRLLNWPGAQRYAFIQAHTRLATTKDDVLRLMDEEGLTTLEEELLKAERP